MDYLVITGEPVTARPLDIDLSDPSDLPFLEVAVETGAPLITGNAAHYEQVAPPEATILTPRQFMASWRNS